MVSVVDPDESDVVPITTTCQILYPSILPLGELGNCLRPPSPKILEKNRVVSNELQK